MFEIDGVQYDVKCTVERAAEIRDSSISGLLLNGQMFHDVWGTYMSYTVRLDMPLHNRGRYAALIEQLTEPVEGHAFVLPYNTETVELTAKVEKPEDVWNRLENGYTYWQGLRFTLNANGPTKQQSLEEAVTRGLTPLPTVYTATIGDTYTFTEDGWEPTASYPDADNIAY